MPASQVLIAGSTFAISDGSVTVPTSAVQTLTLAGTPTSVNLFLGYSGGFGSMFPQTLTTTAIAYTATTTPLTIQNALVALGNIGSNRLGLPNVAVTGPAGGPFVITFQNDLANQPTPLIVTTGTTFTGGTAPTAAVAMTTPGVLGGGVYAALSRLTTLVFPNTKKDVKEVTSFDSAGSTKEYIGGFINPGDVAMDAHWIGDVTQDYRVGIINKFYNGANYSLFTNVPNKVPYPGGFTPGVGIAFSGFFTDATPAGAKYEDVFVIKGSVQISGVPIFSPPRQ